MKELPFITLPFAISSKHIPIVTFRPNSAINVEQISTILSDCHTIYVRSGYHCAQPLFTAHKVAGALRVSLHVYNTEDEVNRFISVLKDLEPILK
jgi:cysteine desulfurase/selenocysteine lyase